MEEQEFIIPIDEPKAEFSKHLEPDHNKRILFSAPFGTGKTYFLNEYFKESTETHKVIHLYPVNYSVSANEDVFELIKFDILFQLMEDESLSFDKITFSNFYASRFYLFYNQEKFIEWILNKFGKVGKGIAGFSKTLDKLIEDYKKFKAEAETDFDSEKGLDYLLKIKNTSGSAYEEDAITQLIQDFLQQLCTEENKKKSVLIIDDLDRIDPEHIFRLLNVFAAHFDIGKRAGEDKDINKFGFDKVIFVCDINNVRNIFHAKYGMDTDFTGYIDKFYSTDVFSFNNDKRIIDTIVKGLMKGFYQNSVKDIVHLRALRTSESFDEILKITLIRLYFSKALNLRSLLKAGKFNIIIPQYSLNFDSKSVYQYANTNLYIVLLFDILKTLFGSYRNIKEAFKKAQTFNQYRIPRDFRLEDDIEHIYSHILTLLTIDNVFEEDEDNNLKTSYEFKGIKYTVIKNRLGQRSSGVLYSRIINDTSDMVNSNYFELLILAFEKLQSYGHLKD